MDKARNLVLLRLGVKDWNEWRKKHPDQFFAPDLTSTNLVEMDLTLADLSGADLRWAELAEAKLLDADLYMARLDGTDLCHVQGLTELQIAEALGDEETLLPPNLQRPNRWGT